MKQIKMEPVESSNIKAVGYCGQHSILRIEFKSGETYEYNNFLHLSSRD